MSHTPGPWINYDATTQGQTNEWHEIDATDGRTIATLDQNPHNDELADWTPEEVRANADFIVRAVNAHDELLAACKAIDALCDELALSPMEAAAEHGPDYEPPTDEECASVRRLLRAAIAKAEGSTQAPAR